jgi:hypothetical protein
MTHRSRHVHKFDTNYATANGVSMAERVRSERELMRAEIITNRGKRRIRTNLHAKDFWCQERLYNLSSNMSVNAWKDSKLTLLRGFT